LSQLGTTVNNQSVQTVASPVLVEGDSNQELLERCTHPGGVVAVGGVTFVNKEMPPTRISRLTKPTHDITQP
jgi:hypothetical protein